MLAEQGCSATACAAGKSRPLKELQGDLKSDRKEANSLPMTGDTKEFCEYTSEVFGAPRIRSWRHWCKAGRQATLMTVSHTR